MLESVCCGIYMIGCDVQRADGSFISQLQVFLSLANNCFVRANMNVSPWEEGCKIFLFKLYICSCGRKTSNTELVHTEHGLWRHPWCHKLAWMFRLHHSGSEIALNKSRSRHHWLHNSPCATDPKNRARKGSRWHTFPFSSPHLPCPFTFLSFQALVGEKYGSIRVPGEVESAEFEMILDAAVEAGLDTHILEEWYCRDENSVPPAYYLKPKAQMLKNYQNSVSPANTWPRHKE